MDRTMPFNWKPSKPVERFRLDTIDRFKERNATIARFEKQLAEATSTRLLDLVDHLTLPDDDRHRRKIERLGFVGDGHSICESYHHPTTRVPRLVIEGTGGVESSGVALRVENIADFLQANHVSAAIEGRPWSPYRRACLTTEGGIAFSVVERRGTGGYKPVGHLDTDGHRYVECLEHGRRSPGSSKMRRLP